MSSERNRPQSFLFLELMDAEINALLLGLRREFGHVSSGTSIHITVRGPYYGEIPGADIAKFDKIVHRNPLLIHGIGLFDNPDESVVYIRVHSDSLEHIWWKPDYPKENFGFHPHITLLKSVDRDFANVVSKFLVEENLKLLCDKFRLTPFTSRQAELFPFPDVPQEPHFLELANRRLVRPDVLQRAANMVASFHRGHAKKIIDQTG